MVDYELERAHKSSFVNREDTLHSDLCGCFYCLATFQPEEIDEWINESHSGGQTALCPKCGIDSVIGSVSGLPITEAFLKQMRDYWF